KVEVRRGVLSLYLNDRLVARCRPDERFEGIVGRWFAGDRAIGLATFNKVVFHRFEIIETMRRGHPLQAIPIGEIPSLKNAAPNDAKNFKDLMPLIDPARDTVRGNWQKSGTDLCSDNGWSSRVRIPYQPPEEYDFRIAFTRTSGIESVRQIVSHA